MQVQLPLRLVVAALTAAAPLAAQEASNPMAQIPWERGPILGSLGERAQVKVPESCLFTGPNGVGQFIEATENIAQGNEVGGMLCATSDSSGYWMVFFSFDDVGYIKDDEKDELDAAKLMQSIQEGTEAANRERRKRGWEEFHVVGWEREPFYDAGTNNLTWAIRGEDEDKSQSVNQSVRLLGRQGVMSVELVASPEDLQSSLPVFESIIGGFSYTTGHKYSEWRQGDKIAAYGLTALVAGGAGALAVKSGLLGKLWKVIVAGAVAVAALVRKLWGRLTGSDQATGSA